MLAVVLLAIFVLVGVFAAVLMFGLFDVAFRDSPNRRGNTVSVRPAGSLEAQPWNKRLNAWPHDRSSRRRLLQGSSSFGPMMNVHRAKRRMMRPQKVT
jgi:hypothetical protein